MKEIERATDKVKTTPPGRRQETWIGKLEKWKIASEKNKMTEEEEGLCKQLLGQLALNDQTTDHLNQVLGEHQGNSERELVKAMKQNNVDQTAYHGGIIVGNH